jgi:hypothetical protein
MPFFFGLVECFVWTASGYAGRTMRTAPLVDLLSSSAADRPAIHDGERTIDHISLCNAADAVAAALVARGVVPGERVAAALPDGPAAIAAFVGTAMARGAFAPLKGDEAEALRSRLERLGSRIVLVGPGISQCVRVAASAAAIPLVSLAIDRQGLMLVDGEPVYDAHGSAPQPDDIVFVGADGTHVTLDGIVEGARAKLPSRPGTVRPSAPLSELRGLIEALAILSAGGQLLFPAAPEAA